MPAIGYVTRIGDIYRGSLQTLSISVQIEIVPNADKDDDRHPDFRIITRAKTEIGAGWWRTGKASGNEYLSLTFAAPELGPRKLHANLGPVPNRLDDREFAIIWNPTETR